MKVLGIDLSLRSTGLFFTNEILHVYELILPDPKKYNNEELLIYNSDQILSFIKETKPTHIGLEGLSFNSVSSSKDLIAGNFWHLRTEIFKNFPDIILQEVAVLSWRSPLFNKEERKTLKENTQQVKLLKKELMTLSKEDKKEKLSENEQLILNSDIKHLTWMKLPENLKSEFESYGGKKGKFDLTDSYFIANYIININKGK